jgi:hypothetical protein
VLFTTGAHLDLEVAATIDLGLVSVGIESVLSYFKIAISKTQLKRVSGSVGTAKIWHIGVRFGVFIRMLGRTQLHDATLHL